MVFLHRHAIGYYLQEINEFVSALKKENESLRELHDGHPSEGSYLTSMRNLCITFEGKLAELSGHLKIIDAYLDSESNIFRHLTSKKIMADAPDDIAESPGFTKFLQSIRVDRDALFKSHTKLKEKITFFLRASSNLKTTPRTNMNGVVETTSGAALGILIELEMYKGLSESLARSLKPYIQHIRAVKEALVKQETDLEVFERNLRSWFSE